MNTEITQTILKGAVKTFVQAFLGILLFLAVPVLLSWRDKVANGEQITLDWNFWGGVLLAAGGAGIAAILSYAQNKINAIPS